MKKTAKETENIKASKTLREKLLKIVRRTLVAGMVISSSVALGSEIANSVKIKKEDEYKTTENIVDDIENFKADPFVIEYYSQNIKRKAEYVRLPHNDTKPIYITFSDDYTKEDLEVSMAGLKYYEDLFKEINPKYRFEVVSDDKAVTNHFLGNTTIHFKKLSNKSFNGVTQQRGNWFQPNFTRISIIKVDFESYATYDEKLYTVLHELAHTFGLGDVYPKEVNKLHYDTFLYPIEVNDKILKLYPNDYALLHVLYNQSLRDENGNIIDENLEKSKQLINKYEENFYSKFESLLSQELNYEFVEELKAIDLENNTFSFYPIALNFQKNKPMNFEYKFHFKPKTNQAELSIFNSEGTLLYKTTTQTKQIGNIIYMPSLELSKGPFPGASYNWEDSLPTNLFLGFAKMDKEYTLIDIGFGQVISLKTEESIDNTKEIDFYNNNNKINGKSIYQIKDYKKTTNNRQNVNDFVC
jgi:hypothetical protein